MLLGNWNTWLRLGKDCCYGFKEGNIGAERLMCIYLTIF